MIRTFVSYENDISNLYDFVMHFFKLLSAGLQDELAEDNLLIGMLKFL